MLAGPVPALAGASEGRASEGRASGRVNLMQCRAKCAVRAMVPPAITAWNCVRVFSRCTLSWRQGCASLPLTRPTHIGPRDTIKLNSQTFAAFGAAGVDDGTAPPGFHANQETVGACAAYFGRLVCAFHLEIPIDEFWLATDYRKFIESGQHLTRSIACNAVGTATFTLFVFPMLTCLWINP